MPVGLEQLSGQVRDDEAQKRDGSHHGGGHSNAEGYAQQQAADAAVIIHTQIDGLLLSKGQYVQQGQLFSQGKDYGCQKDQGKNNDLRVYIAEAGHQGVHQTVILIGIHDPGQRRLDAAEEGGQHCTHQQHIQYIVLCLFKDPAVNNCGRNAHEHHIHCKGQIRIGGCRTGRSQEKYHCRMDEGIEGIHPQQTGCHNGVVDDGLEHQ